MVAVAVTAILSLVAVPAMMSLVKNNRMTTTANDLVRDTLIARSEAVKRNAPVTICKSSDSTAANPTCNTTAAAWTIGWIVFVDSDSNGQRSGGEALIRVHAPLSNAITLTDQGGFLAYNLLYTPAGRVRYYDGGNLLFFNKGTLRLCDDRGLGNAKTIVVNYAGRAYVPETAVDHDGNAIGSCT